MTNFSPQLSSGTAIFMALLAASMWGSWFVSLKHLGKYPLDGFFVVLFSTSLLFVWAVGVILDGRSLFGNIADVLAEDPVRVVATLAGGMAYVIGMRFQLTVLSIIGLSLAQPIQSSIGILTGAAVTVLVGGRPPGLPLRQLLLAILVLVGAVLITMLAARYRSQAQALMKNAPMQTTTKDLWWAVGLILLASCFTPAYPFALSFGLRSSTHPQGLAVLPFMALLASGAFSGAMLTCGRALLLSGQWRLVIRAPFAIHKWAIGSVLFHYGGNIIHTFATAFLSSAVTWPLGVTSSLWTQVWGLAYGEFRGAPLKAYLALFAAFLLYLTGAYLIAHPLS